MNTDMLIAILLDGIIGKKRPSLARLFAFWNYLLRKISTMSIRKLIREQLEEMIGSDNTIKGVEILNYFPFSELPETRADVDWSNRDVKGWGAVHVPSVQDGDASQGVFGKDDIHEYVSHFNRKFGEEPLFVLNQAAPWYDKVKIVNPSYIEWSNKYKSGKQSFVNQFGSGD
jgi:hypothetical protein